MCVEVHLVVKSMHFSSLYHNLYQEQTYLLLVVCQYKLSDTCSVRILQLLMVQNGCLTFTTVVSSSFQLTVHSIDHEVLLFFIRLLLLVLLVKIRPLKLKSSLKLILFQLPSVSYVRAQRQYVTILSGLREIRILLGNGSKMKLSLNSVVCQSARTFLIVELNFFS